MSLESNDRLEFRYYDMPEKCPVLCLYGDDWKMPYGDRENPKRMHFHNVLEIGICREGTGELWYPNEKKSYGPGDISIIPRNYSHTTLSEYSWWEYVFLDAEAYLNRFAGKESTGQKWEDIINSRPLLFHGEEHPGFREIIDSMIREQREAQIYANAILDASALQMLFLIARENQNYISSLGTDFSREDRKIRTALEYIENHYNEELTIGQLAARAGMSEPHCRRLFREILHIAPLDYLNMVRIRHACHLLLSTELPIELIAERCGYMTPSTFYRNFQHFFSDTPLQWRKNQLSSKIPIYGIQIARYPGWGQEDNK